MSGLSRAGLVQIHMLLASFMFPVALMFLVTGGFYTWGVKGSYDSNVYMLSLEKPLEQDKSYLESLVRKELGRLAISVPSGKASVKKGGTSFKLEWTGSGRDVVLEPTADELEAKLTIKETTWYRNLVQLHKAKGGQIFKFYAAGLATALFIILASGFLMAWQVPMYRRQALFCSAAGVIVFLLMIASS